VLSHTTDVQHYIFHFETQISSCLLDIDAVFPAANTVFDYFVDISKNDLIGWDTKVPSWRAVKTMTFHDMIGTSITP